jgi:hypothetical protein
MDTPEGITWRKPGEGASWGMVSNPSQSFQVYYFSEQDPTT